MNYKAYINYINGGRIHAGVFIDDCVIYVSEAEPLTSHALMGYVEVSLHNDVPRSWDAIESVVRDGLTQLRTVPQATTLHVETQNGALGLLARPGVPQTAADIMSAFRNVHERITASGTVRQIPQTI